MADPSLIKDLVISDEAWEAIHLGKHDAVFDKSAPRERYRNARCRFVYYTDIKLLEVFVIVDDRGKEMLIGTLRHGQSFKWNPRNLYRNDKILMWIFDGIDEMEQELLNGT